MFGAFGFWEGAEMIFGWKTKPEWIAVHKQRELERQAKLKALAEIAMMKAEMEMIGRIEKVPGYRRYTELLKNSYLK